MNDPKQELEHLRKLANREPQKRFDHLHRIVRHTAFLAQVWQRVQQNKGSNTPGVDGETKRDVTHKTLQTLSEELAMGRYEPRPVRRAYIPKGKGQKRGLGIPSMRDRIIQGAVADVLEVLYEPIFRNCSYGFRPQRNTMQALRHVATAYRAGATWVIEGDLVKCFDSIPHDVVLRCLRKRIKDERFIDLIRRMLQAGVMESGQYRDTYAGTPQGGLVSPLLANIVLHEFDCWMETHQGVNPKPQTSQMKTARSNPEYRRWNSNLSTWRAQLDGRRPMRRQTPELLKSKIADAEKRLAQLPCYLPRRVMYYCRYADDYLVVLCNYSKAEAVALKDAMAQWLNSQLGLEQHPEKTHITHWTESFRFLGYQLKGHRNTKGSRWLRLSIPHEAESDLTEKVKRLCGYTQIPEVDLFTSVNAQMRGWANYYCYANDAGKRFDRLTGIVYWLTAHFLGRKTRCSIKDVMRTHYGRDPQTGRLALYINRPNGKALFIWNKPPRHKSILTGQLTADGDKPPVMMDWANGHSLQQREEMYEKHQKTCQHCGATNVRLIVHHPRRMARQPDRKKGSTARIRSAQEQETKLLCHDCHKRFHHNNWKR